MFKGTVKIKGKMVEGNHVVHCLEPAVLTHGMDSLVNTSRFSFPSVSFFLIFLD